MGEQKLVNLSKIISHALRHEPQFYDLVLDKYGWVKLSDLVDALQKKSLEFVAVQQNDILHTAENSKKKRFEIAGDRIRALYGHSTSEKIIKYKEIPPVLLYHGTGVSRLENIFNKGLLSMNRQYVHLSEDIETAKIVAKRRKEEVNILVIQAINAHDNGISFYREENKVWLSEPIPSMFIKF